MPSAGSKELCAQHTCTHGDNKIWSTFIEVLNV